MNTLPRLSAILAAITLAAHASSALAASPTKEFKNELKEIVAKKKGNGATKAIAKLLDKSVQSDPELIVSFNKLANNALKKILKPNQRGSAVSALVKAAGLSFFKGQKSYDPENPIFQNSIKLLIASLPESQKTEAVIGQIFEGLEKLNQIKKGTPAQLQILANLVYLAAGLTPPNVS